MQHLKLGNIIGFSGNVCEGLKRHPDGEHIVYPLGSMVVMKNLQNPEKQYFFQGHTNAVTAVDISKSGRYIASGQQTHMGYLADIFIWDVATQKIVHKMTIHKVKVQALAFSPNEKYLVSLGGEDDNSIVMWDLQTGAAICGAAASKGSTGLSLCLKYSNHDDGLFVSAGNSNIRVWRLDEKDNRVHPSDCQTGQIKRVVKNIIIDSKDEYFYCGTTTGDVLQLQIKTSLFKSLGPPKTKDLFSLGVQSSLLHPKDESIVVIGCGDGSLAALKLPKFTVLQSTKLEGGITSIIRGKDNELMVATSISNIYSLNLDTFETRLVSSCHYAPINDIVFPVGAASLMATASDRDVRVWNVKDGNQLLKINVPNCECKALLFSKEGHSLLTAWSDGRIRAYGPQSGRLQFEIIDAHKSGVTALAATDAINEDGDYRIISGGSDGQIRIWLITRHTRRLEETMKEHKGAVSAIFLRKNNMECVSASADGSCIVWDLERKVRNQILFAATFFKEVVYTPDESQILTSGTDRKVSYWEAYDGSLIRELEASQSDAINGLDISPDGKRFVIGGSDKLVKVYKYDEGDVESVGVGHSSEITKVKIAPNGELIASVSTDGAILLWTF